MEAQIAQVLQATNLVEIIEQTMTLNKHDAWPFPDDRNGRQGFVVGRRFQRFHCYSCHRSGNAINFLELFNGLTRDEAIEFLARRSNIALSGPVI